LPVDLRIGTDLAQSLAQLPFACRPHWGTQATNQESI